MALGQGKESRKPDSEEKPQEIADEATQWEKQRLEQLDHLEILVRQGKYKVEPSMVEMITLRLMRMAVTA